MNLVLIFILFVSTPLFAQHRGVRFLGPFFASELPTVGPEVTDAIQGQLRSYFEHYGYPRIHLVFERAIDFSAMRTRFRETHEARLMFQLPGYSQIFVVTIGPDMYIRCANQPIIDRVIRSLMISNDVEVYHFPPTRIFSVSEEDSDSSSAEEMPLFTGEDDHHTLSILRTMADHLLHTPARDPSLLREFPPYLPFSNQ